MIKTENKYVPKCLHSHKKSLNTSVFQDEKNCAPKWLIFMCKWQSPLEAIVIMSWAKEEINDVTE